MTDDPPRTYDEHEWVLYLERRLTRQEHRMFKATESEATMNKNLKKLQKRGVKHNLRIPRLSSLDGNCMFDSLLTQGIGKSIQQLRNSISFILFQFKDVKGFIPGQAEMTLEEIFTTFALPETLMTLREYDIDKGGVYLYNFNKQKLYRYTYDLLCRLVATEGYWDIIPANMILLVLSRMYNVEFNIVRHDENNVITFSAYEGVKEPPELRKVWLGHIFENHYLPFEDIPPEVESLKIKKYLDYHVRFKAWAECMQVFVELKQKYLADNYR